MASLLTLTIKNNNVMLRFAVVCPFLEFTLHNRFAYLLYF